MARPTDKRTNDLRRWEALKHERSTWLPHWQQLSRVFMPRTGRFVATQRNKGTKRHNDILDDTGTRAVRTLAAGMMSGMTSPARPWMRLSVPDANVARSPAVKQWLADVTGIMLDVFARSNTYRALHSAYEELAVYGTSAIIVQYHPERVIHLTPLTAGEYAIATDWEGTPNTLFREFERPVSEIVGEFGYDNVSKTVRDAYDRGDLDQWFSILHVIEPRADRDPSKMDARNMAWRSCYWEMGCGEGDPPLREGGYRNFPALVSRWAVSSGDIYGASPGMDALGGARSLQHQQLRKASVLDYETNPPLVLPTTLKASDVDTLPGGRTYTDPTAAAGIRTLFNVGLRADNLIMDIQDTRQRIRAAFFEDLFLMLTGEDKTMTATEVAERREEKMLALGPVLERLHNELLEPLIDNTFACMLRAGIVPPPPPELENTELTVQFISVLAQAQRAVRNNSSDRLLAGIANIAGLKPEAVDVLDQDAWVRDYAEALGTEPSLLLPDDAVAALRQQRAQAQAQAQAMQAANVGADTAQKLGKAPTANGSNALQDVMSLFSGYSSPPPEAY